jgi:hypothetical protein
VGQQGDVMNATAGYQFVSGVSGRHIKSFSKNLLYFIFYTQG